jgi:hypothetical protein
MDNLFARCPECRAECDISASIHTNITGFCSISRTEDRMILLVPCHHGVGIQSYYQFVHNFGYERAAEAGVPPPPPPPPPPAAEAVPQPPPPPPAEEMPQPPPSPAEEMPQPPPPPPPAVPRWQSSWTECRYQEFNWRGHRLMWVHYPFAFYDISLINLETGNLYWEGKSGPRPPPPHGVEGRGIGGGVDAVYSSRRWIFYPAHAGAGT